MSHNVLYHNPRCSKSRQALAFLEQQNIEFEVHDYLKNPLTSHQLEQLFNALKINDAVEIAHDMLRTKEGEYKEAELSADTPDAQVLSAISKHPKLLERPIFLMQNKAAIGRPLDNIESLISD